METKVFNNKRVVLIGGGTGNSVLLRTLKFYTQNISVIVSVGDDGGSSGLLRREMGTIPPGDIRNCLVALADEENIMAEVMDTRFTHGLLKTQSLGNLILVALSNITGSFPMAIKKAGQILAIKGKVYPVSTEKIELVAKYANGKLIRGESKIGGYGAKHHLAIDRIMIEPKGAPVFTECINAIMRADYIIYSPGSLYTSLIPNLLVDGICDALEETSATRIYLPNIMTEHGETDGYNVSAFIEAIEKHSGGKRIIDKVIYNTQPIPENIKVRYKSEGAEPVDSGISEEHKSRYEFTGLDLADYSTGVVRHDSKVVWEHIFGTVKKDQI